MTQENPVPSARTADNAAPDHQPPSVHDASPLAPQASTPDAVDGLRALIHHSCDGTTSSAATTSHSPTPAAGHASCASQPTHPRPGARSLRQVTAPLRTVNRPSTTLRGYQHVRLARCPHRQGEAVNRRTGELTPSQCRRLSCPYCVIARAHGVSEALGHARITWAVTVHEIGETWPQVRDNFKLFKQHLRRRGVDFQFAYNVEPYTDGPNNHAHLWVRSADLAMSDLRAASSSARLGTVHQERGYTKVTASGRPYIDYGLKMILEGDATDSADLWPSAVGYLERNGGRLIHSTRDFWLDPDGNRCTLLEAVTTARRHRAVRRPRHS